MIFVTILGTMMTEHVDDDTEHKTDPSKKFVCPHCLNETYAKWLVLRQIFECAKCTSEFEYDDMVILWDEWKQIDG